MTGLPKIVADWLENGRPSERAAMAEAAQFGSLLWMAGGVRAFEQQDGDVYRLRLAGAGLVVAYEVVGVDGGCPR
ncbi:hypothetical protein [Streptomyces sp. NPDC003483]